MDAGASAKSLDRPQLQAALDRLATPVKRRDVDGIVVAKLDRLSRSVADFAGVLKLAAGRQWSLVALDLGVDTSTPTGELVANVMMSVAQWERRVISDRTSAALQAAKRRGTQIGPVSKLPEATAVRLMELRDNYTLDGTAQKLNAEGHTTATGKTWDKHAVCKAQKRINNAIKLGEARAEYERQQAA